MYEYYTKEKLNKLFPILETEANAIVSFVSCDGNTGYKLASVLGALNPEMKYSFENNCRDGKIKKGIILTNKKSYPFIIQIPFKETFKDKPSFEYLRAGFEKLELACKERIVLDSIAIQRGIMDDEILEEALKGLDLPEIKFYDEINPYERFDKEKVEVKEKTKK